MIRHDIISNLRRLHFAWFACIVLFLQPFSGTTQTVSFSQYYNNPLYYNPAFSGSELGFRARMHFRNQFGSLSETYDNATFSMDFSERNIPGSGGFGLLLLSDFDGIGLVRTTSVRLSYAARIRLSENVITQVGIGPTFVNRRVDWARLVFSDQVDPHYGITNPTAFDPPERDNINYPDLSLGVLFQFFGMSDRFSNVITTISGSVDHVLQPDISFSGAEHKLPLKFVVSANVLLDNAVYRGNTFHMDRSHFRINPGFLYERHHNLNALSAGINGYKNHIYSGIWGRVQQYDDVNITDIVLLLGVDIPLGEESRLKVMYSYDYLVGGLMRSVGNTHEISAVIELGNFTLFGEPDERSRRFRNVRRLECPSF